MPRAGPGDGAAPPSARSGAVARRAATLVGVSSVADLAAVAQLVTTGSGTGVLVAGLLSVLAGFLGLLQLSGRAVGRRTFAMAVLIAVGAGTSGAVLHGYWADTGPRRDDTSAADTTTTSGAPVTSSGAVVRMATVHLRDQDYLDVETGTIGEVQPGASDLWYVGGYRELWTAGGGELPITPVEPEPDFAACMRELAGRSYDSVAGEDLRPGSWACARTAEGNVVAVRVAASPARGEDGELSISYTVWHE